MPVSLRIPLRRLSQTEFGEIAYEVMRHVFAIHNEIGRFFDEKIYKAELANRLPHVRLEEPIDVAFGPFVKRLFIDVLVDNGAIFEFKAVESLAGRHRAQLLQYLLLCGLAHGKLINVRPENVEHDFVNTRWEREDRVRFEVQADRWSPDLPAAARLFDFLTGLLRDLGAGLQISLYEEAVVQCFGGPEAVEANLGVTIGGRLVGRQRVRLVAPGVAVKITALDEPLDRFEAHARRLLAHMDLKGIAWVNVNKKRVTFTTLER